MKWVTLERVLLGIAVAMAGVALYQSMREQPETVTTEEPDRVVAITLLCLDPGDQTLRDSYCLAKGDNGNYLTPFGRHYRLTIKSQGFAYEVEYPALFDISIGDQWPPNGPSKPYEQSVPRR